ncbi:MAG: hypothetical protein Q9159_007748, partial [Coniocarpon cinnabarinum]
ATGTPLAWPEAKQKADQVRDWGIQQLLATWRRAKGKERDAMLWGDEIEYLVCCFDDSSKRVRLSLCQSDILEALASDEKLKQGGGAAPKLNDEDRKAIRATPTFHPEFGRFMLEATPGKPWGIDFNDLLQVENDMKLRRKIAREHMADAERPVTLTTFPLLGLPDATVPAYPESGERLRSQFLPDEIANPHIRFPTLAANIRSRRGRKVELNVPVFHDEKTPTPFSDPSVNYDLHRWPEDDDVRHGAVKPNSIYMDAMAFGMGSCCLQLTFQAKNIDEGRKMYDQLSPLGPILLALTAATPVYKGMLADTDVRWNQISAAVDDRTKEELGEVPLKENRFRIPKSRYASNSTYISNDKRLRPEYHDPNLIVAPEVRERLMQGGMDTLLATHFAHLFIRDPLVIFEQDMQTLDLNGTDHFENLQSTNWQHMRFKPPPPGSDTGWRVEFRPMEIQMTDFENAAFSVFIVLVTRALLSFDLNFYLPIQRTTENMETAHRRDAVLNDRFYFRKDPFSSWSTGTNVHATDHAENSHPSPVENEYTLMTINEIINGAKPSADDLNPFPGLLPLVESYLDSVNVNVEVRCELSEYLEVIKKRASGEWWTGAKWIREFVRSHPKYGNDSMVGRDVAYDLCVIAEKAGTGDLSGVGPMFGKSRS